jgi:hypothetical protein
MFSVEVSVRIYFLLEMQTEMGVMRSHIFLAAWRPRRTRWQHSLREPVLSNTSQSLSSSQEEPVAKHIMVSLVWLLAVHA